MKKLIILFVFNIFCSNLVISAELITLKSAVENALMNNFSIKISKVSNKISDNNVNPGNAGMLPRVDVNAGYNFSNTDLYMALVTGQRIEQAGNASKTVNAGVQLSWTILDDMGMFISYERLKSLKSKSDIELKLSVETAVKDISKTYYNILLIQKNIEVLNESILLSNQRVERIKNRQDYGVSTSLELLRAQVDLNTDSANYKRAVLNYNTNKRLLNYLTGNNVSQDFSIDSTLNFLSFSDLKEYRDLSQKANWTILQQVKNKQITELEYKLLKTTYMPKINLTAGYNFSRTDADAGFMLVNQNYGFQSGVNISWNIFDGFKTNTQAENTKLMSEINSLTIEMVRNQIDMAVINNYESLKEKMNILSMDISNLAAAEKNYSRSLDLYNLGQLTSLELREAQLNLTRTKMRINESMIDAKMSEIELNILSGTLKY